MKVVCFKLYLLIVFVLSAIGLSAQDLNPIRWELKTQNPAVKINEVFNVQVIATIDEGWHLYSIEQPPGGPIPTRIFVPENQLFTLNGEIESPISQVVFDPNFNMDTQFFEKEAIFSVPLKANPDLNNGKHNLTVTAFYQTCNDKTCLPPKTVKLTAEIEITGGSQSVEKINNSAKTVAETKVLSTSKEFDSTPVEFNFIDFAGKQRKISEFRGKFVLLDFWATWCRPCLADIPKLKVLYEKYHAQGFDIVGMDSETLSDDAEEPDPEFAKETAERAKQIVKTRGAVWTHATAETAVPVAKKVFGVKTLPTKILLDKEGKIIATIGEKDDLTGIVEKLLSEKK